jgi:hypothetical protein
MTEEFRLYMKRKENRLTQIQNNPARHSIHHVQSKASLVVGSHGMSLQSGVEEMSHKVECQDVVGTVDGMVFVSYLVHAVHGKIHLASHQSCQGQSSGSGAVEMET